MVEITKRFVWPDRVVWYPAAGGITVHSLGDDTYLMLRDVAASIWKLADGARTVDEIAGRICDEYEVDRTIALADCAQLIDHLVSRQFLAEVD